MRSPWALLISPMRADKHMHIVKELTGFRTYASTKNAADTALSANDGIILKP